METGVEVGHVFKLGTHYSEAMGATCTDDSGAARPFVMGCYGIGINRILAAVAETRADEDGLIWPPEIAPYAVVLLPLGLQDEAIRSAAEGAYEALTGAGIDALLDDRDESPGVRFNDADLIGFPVRIVVGRRYHETGNLEMQVRRDRSRTEVAPESVVEAVQAALERLRPGAARDAAGIRSGEE
jgi:prolyl-tRNA synthetase